MLNPVMVRIPETLDSQTPAPVGNLDDNDRALVRITQSGLPLVPQPYRAIADRLGIPAEEAMLRLRRLMDAGIVRRIGVVPNHYALGYSANGMSVWDVADEHVDALGAQVGRLPFVSHCYRRPRAGTLWPYNLFAMVHGKSRDEVSACVDEIAQVLGAACRGHDILYSSRILKKTGLRI